MIETRNVSNPSVLRKCIRSDGTPKNYQLKMQCKLCPKMLKG